MQEKKEQGMDTEVVETATKSVDLLQEKILEWVDNMIIMLPNLIVAVLIFTVFIVFGKILKNLVSRILKRFSHHPALDSLFTSLTFVAVVLLGLFISLGILDLDKTVTSLLAGAGIIGLALGFAFQDVAANFMSGIIIILRRPFLIGDIIGSNEHFGTVENTSFRSTVIRTPQGQTVFIPNKEIFQNPLVNYTKIGTRRIDLKVGVSYGDDLEKVKKITLEAVKSIDILDKMDKNNPIDFFYEEFGDSSINFVVRFWVNFRRQPDYLAAKSEAIMKIKSAFDNNDITIPFPIRTLDFGIKGGQTLSDMKISMSNGQPLEKSGK